MKPPNQWPPMFEEYFGLHRRHGSILAWQMGASWEFYLEEAHQVAALLDLSVTSCGTKPNGEPIPVCSIPANAGFSVAGDCLLVPLVPTDHPFGKIVQAGHALAIAVHAPEPRATPDEHRIVAVFWPDDWPLPPVGRFVTLVGKVERVLGCLTG
jgi:MutS domain I